MKSALKARFSSILFLLLSLLLCAFAPNAFAAENMAYISPYPQNFTAHTLSSLAEISLITFDAGSSLYRAFGHSSIRVSDPVKNIDKLFTFGAIENIDSPSVLLSLLYSRIETKAGAARFYDVLQYDIETQNRLIIEQKLNFSHEDKEKIYSYLLWKTQEVNKADKYDITKNNCATLSRDVIRLAWPTSLSENSFLYKPASPLSYRSLIVPKLTDRPWTALVADFFLGSVADRKAELYDMTFLPDVLRSVLSIAHTKSGDETLPLVKSTTILFAPNARNQKRSIEIHFAPKTPELILILLAAAAMIATVLQPIFFLLSRKHEKAIAASRIIANMMQSFDILFFFITGIFGLLALLLSFGGRSAITAGNINFLWVLPTNIIFAFTCYKEKSSPLISGYFLALVYLNIFVLIFQNRFIQHFNIAFTPVLLITICRAFFQAVNRPLKEMLQANV